MSLDGAGLGKVFSSSQILDLTHQNMQEDDHNAIQDAWNRASVQVETKLNGQAQAGIRHAVPSSGYQGRRILLQVIGVPVDGWKVHAGSGTTRQGTEIAERGTRPHRH